MQFMGETKIAIEFKKNRKRNFKLIDKKFYGMSPHKYLQNYSFKRQHYKGKGLPMSLFLSLHNGMVEILLSKFLIYIYIIHI